MKRNIKYKKGVAIEYAILLLALISVFIVGTLLTSVAISSKTNTYRNYVEQKEIIDDMGSLYLNGRKNKESINITNEKIASKYQDNIFTWQINESSFIVTRNQVVRLLIEISYVDSNMEILTYQYGII